MAQDRSLDRDPSDPNRPVGHPSFEDLLGAAPVGLLALDATGRPFYMNEPARRLLGSPEHDPESLDQLLAVLIPDEEQRQDMFKLFESARLGPAAKPVSARVAPRGCGVLWCQFNARALPGGGVIFSCHDQTPQKVLEQELSLSRERYRTLARNFPNGAVALFDQDIRFMLLEGQAAEMDGFNLLKAGKTLDEVFPEPLLSEIKPHFQAALKGERRFFQAEYNDQIFETLLVPVTNEAEEVVMGLLITQVVTERVRAEAKLRKALETLEQQVQERTADLRKANEKLQGQIAERERVQSALQQSESRLRELIHKISAAVVIHDRDGHILQANEMACTLMGMSEAELRSLNSRTVPWTVYNEEGRRLRFVHYPFIQAIRTRKRIEVVMGIDVPGASARRWLVITADPVFTPDGEILEIIDTFMDITPLKTLQQELEGAKESAERANRLKSEFLANMSHEIRTPMNGIFGMLQLLSSTDLDAEQAEYVQSLEDSANTLLNLLNGILDLSKIEAERLILEKELFSPGQALRAVATIYEPLARDKQLDFVLEGISDLSLLVQGDNSRLQQVLVNLIDNAVKFTEQGRIRVSGRLVEVRECAEPQDCTHEAVLEFMVADTGIGISPENQKLIFEAFTQGDGAFTRHFGGTGLGLALSQKLAELMGGTINVDSEPGRGSTFRLRLALPLDPESLAEYQERASAPPSIPSSILEEAKTPETAETPAKTPPRHLNILLAEDNPVNARFLVSVLKRAGHGVRHAKNGIQAVEFFAKERFDLILMDIEMPEMNGLDATTAIREATDIPIIALSADSMHCQGEHFADLGFAAYLSKPIQKADLLEALAKYQ